MANKLSNSTGQHWPWIGQTAFGRSAIDMLERGTWPATVLWSGPAHLGKATAALWLVQRDWCENIERRPCGTCSNCQQVATGTHPDGVVISTRNETAVSLEETHRTLQSLQWKPQHSQERRWILFLDVDELSEAIGNSILKLIEEPPTQTCILMTSSHPEKILPTIRSRAIEFHWHRVPQNELETALEQVAKNETTADRRAIVRQSAGRPGVAMNLTRHPEQLTEQWSVVQALMRGLTSGRWPQRREWTADDLDRAEDLVRDALLVQTGAGVRTWIQQTAAIESFAQQLGFVRLQRLAASLVRRHDYLRQHVQPSFILHDLSF